MRKKIWNNNKITNCIGRQCLYLSPQRKQKYQPRKDKWFFSKTKWVIKSASSWNIETQCQTKNYDVRILKPLRCRVPSKLFHTYCTPWVQTKHIATINRVNVLIFNKWNCIEYLFFFFPFHTYQAWNHERWNEMNSNQKKTKRWKRQTTTTSRI